MGEQVAGANGEVWLTGVRACLEAQGYGFRAADMCAAGVGAPQIRQRLFWLGYDLSAGLERWQKQPARDQCAAIERVGDVVGMADGGRQSSAGRGNGEDVVGAKKVAEGETRQRERLWDAVDDCGANGGLADGNGGESGNGELQPIGKHRFVPQDGGIAHGLANGENDGRNQVSANDAGSACGNVAQGSAAGLGLRGSFSGLAYKSRERRNGRCDSAESHGRLFVEASSGLVRPDGTGSCAREQVAATARHGRAALAASNNDWVGNAKSDDESWQRESESVGGWNGEIGRSSAWHNKYAWDDFECVPCADGCVRRIEAGTFPLVSAGMDAKATRKWLARMLRGFMPGRNIRERRANARRLAAAIVAAQKGRAQSAAQPVANGVPVAMVCGDDSRGPQDEISFAEVQATAEERVMRLRMYGNAIVPQLAAEFILAFEDEMREQ